MLRTLNISFLSLILIVLTFSCGPSTVSSTQKEGVQTNVSEENSSDTLFDLSSLFSLSDAEKILGEAAYLSDSSWSHSKGISTYNCAFTAKEKDPKSGKTGNIYILIEKYDQITSAQKKYISIKKANENHKGIKTLYDLGDEAYFHSDGENFYFIMVRKGRYVFNMKVNKITSKTSQVAFMEVAREMNDVL